MAKRSLEDLYISDFVPIPVPRGGNSLSTMHGLSKQVRADTGRPGRVPTTRSQHYNEPVTAGFETSRIQNVQSGGSEPIAPPKFIPSVPKKPEFGGGPGVGPAEGTATTGGLGVSETGGISPAPGQNPGEAAVASMIGNNIAGSMASKGSAAATTTGVIGTAMGFPVEAVAPAAVQSGVVTALGPIGLAQAVNKGIGGVISAEPSLEAYSAMTESGVPTSLAVEATKGIMKGLPQTATAYAKDLIMGKSPVQEAKQFAKEVSDLTVANAPMAGGGGSDSAFGPSNFGPTMAGLHSALDAMNTAATPTGAVDADPGVVGPGYGGGSNPSAPTGRGDAAGASPDSSGGMSGRGDTSSPGVGSIGGITGATGQGEGAGAGPK